MKVESLPGPTFAIDKGVASEILFISSRLLDEFPSRPGVQEGGGSDPLPMCWLIDLNDGRWGHSIYYIIIFFGVVSLKMESFGLGSRTFNLETIFKSSSLPPATQTHISNAYLGLTATAACAALGAYASARGVLRGGGDMLFVPAVALFGILMWLGSTRGVVTKARIAGLCGFGFLKGLTLGPLLAIAVGIDPSIVMTAFLGTAAVFVCFSMAALVAKRREYMYMGAFLSSAVMILLVLSIANIFFRSAALFTFELYVGLLVFTGYVLVDTQVMVESAIAGNRDWVWHALELFIDFAAVFVRILIILLNNKKQEHKRKQEQQRRRG